MSKKKDQLLRILAVLDGHFTADDISPADADRWRELKRHITRMKDGLDLARIELESLERGAPQTKEIVGEALQHAVREILMVLKMASVMAIHSCSLGAPILLEEAKEAGAKPTKKDAGATPACDKMRPWASGIRHGNPFFELDPAFTDQFMATVIAIYGSRLFTPKEVELLSIAFDASYAHMYAPDTRRHIKGVLKEGATVEEIMEVLKLCVVQGVQACNLGVPILAKELERSDRRGSNEHMGWSRAPRSSARTPEMQEKS